MSAIRSALIQSGMKIVTGCPRARPTAQNEIPVLPLVASTISAPGCELPRFPGAPEDVQRHPVLDAAGQVQALGLGVEPARRAAVHRELDGEQRRVPDEHAEAAQPVGVGKSIDHEHSMRGRREPRRQGNPEGRPSGVRYALLRARRARNNMPAPKARSTTPQRRFTLMPSDRA